LPTCAFIDANAATPRHDVIGNDKGLPASIAGLFGTALGLYARRFPYYGILALISIGVQYVVDTQVMLDFGLMLGLDVVVGAFLAASVSIGVAFDLAGKEADWSRIMTAASLRWGAVTLVALIVFLTQWLYGPYVALPPGDTAYGLLLLPFIVFSGALSLATVVASIEPTQSRLKLPLIALGKALSVSAQFVNLGRLVVLSVLLTLPLFAELLLASFLRTHNVVADLDFWSDIPIDVNTLGPLQAIMTVFYVDFLRRSGRGKIP
jgi:hypothetical protein